MSLTAKINEINNIYHIAKIVPLFQSRPVFLHEKATLGKICHFIVSCYVGSLQVDTR